MSTTPEQFNKNQIAAGKLTDGHIKQLVEYWQKGHGLLVDGRAGDRETIPSLNEWAGGAVSHEPAHQNPSTPARGRVVPLTRAQVVARARYLAGQASISSLDEHVRCDPRDESMCPAIYYLLKGHNGGTDPTAPDPADRWSSAGSTFVNRTADCSGGNAWMHGFDRYQPSRFAHLYDGWINTDSKIMDARGERRCFRSVGRPEPGVIIVFMSDEYGIGHEGTVVAYRGDLSAWDPKVAASWKLIDVVDVASWGAGVRANNMHDGSWWFGRDTMFLESVMR